MTQILTNVAMTTIGGGRMTQMTMAVSGILIMKTSVDSMTTTTSTPASFAACVVAVTFEPSDGSCPSKRVRRKQVFV